MAHISMPDLPPNNITIAHSNVRSLIPKMHLVRRTLNDQNIDVMCITETWLTPKTKTLDLSGYKIVRRDRLAQSGKVGTAASTRGGGVAILYREHLHVNILNIGKGDKACESLWVSLHGGDGQRAITVGAVYRPPSAYPSKGVLDVLHGQLQAAVAIDQPVFCLGDFNINIMDGGAPGVRKTNTILSDLSISQLVTKPTRLTPRESLLDWILTNRPEMAVAVSVPPSPIADHLTTIVSVSE